MGQAQASQGGQQESSEGLARIVLIKPGSSSEKSLKIEVDSKLSGATVDEVLGSAIKSSRNRSDERLAERIQEEMKDTYGIVVNGTPVKGEEKIAGHFVKDQLQSGTPYLKAEIVVAAKQQGGYGIEKYLR